MPLFWKYKTHEISFSSFILCYFTFPLIDLLISTFFRIPKLCVKCCSIPFCEVISSSIKLLFLKSDKYQVLRYSILASGTYCNIITYLLHIFATIEVVDTLSVPMVQLVQNTWTLPHILPWHNYFLQQVDFRFQYILYHDSVQIRM